MTVPSPNVGGRLEVERDGGTALMPIYKTVVWGIGAPKVARVVPIDRGVSVLRALGTTACARMSREPERASAHLRGRPISE
jgi:hypothetical protein